MTKTNELIEEKQDQIKALLDRPTDHGDIAACHLEEIDRLRDEIDILAAMGRRSYIAAYCAEGECCIEPFFWDDEETTI